MFHAAAMQIIPLHMAEKWWREQVQQSGTDADGTRLLRTLIFQEPERRE